MYKDIALAVALVATLGIILLAIFGILTAARQKCIETMKDKPGAEIALVCKL